MDGRHGLDDYRDHVIVCGLNRLGLRIVEQLHAAAVDVVVIDDSDSQLRRRRLERWGVPILREQVHSAEALTDAGVDRAAALIACHDLDLTNLETALGVAEMAPALRLVVQFTNPQLADQVRVALPAATVLNLAGKAGPSFVEACIRSDVLHAFRMGGETFQVADVPVTRSGAFRQIYGDLTPVSLRRPDLRLAEVCPGRDTVLAPGDRLALLGRVVDFTDNGVAVAGQVDTAVLARLSSPEGLATPSGRPRRRARAWLRDQRALLAAELDRPFRIALCTVLSIMATSTLVLWLAYRSGDRAAPRAFDALDALYLTVETMVTVGYGDFSFGAADHWLMVYGILLMIFGALSIAIVYAFITNVIISRRLEQAFGRGRATTVRDHVIVCGLGSVGLAAMEGLVTAGRPVVVIERDENNRYLPVARDRGVPVIVGDATVRATLMDAGLARATTLAALTSDDVANLETVLSARDAFEDVRVPRRDRDARQDLRVVLRVFDTRLAEEVERRFDIHTARSASALATPWFVGAALGYEVISTFYIDSTPFIVARMQVTTNGGLDGPTLQELSTGTRVLTVTSSGRGRAGQQDYRPTRYTRLSAGDELLVVGPYAQIIDMVRRNRRVDVDRQSAR
jgi:Trk K+ transport system NAD-binding subunit